MKRRILMTTPSEAIRGMATDIDKSLETCYHFNGLYYGFRDADHSEHQELELYARAASRLIGIVNTQRPDIVAFGASGPALLMGTTMAAFEILQKTKVKAVIATTITAVAGGGFYEMHIFEFSAGGLHVVRSFAAIDETSIMKAFIREVHNAHERHATRIAA
jgi:hypothetical protein